MEEYQMTDGPSRTLDNGQSEDEPQTEDEMTTNDTPKKQLNVINRWRSKGRQLLHSKAVLLIVVILNCIDCILVLSELTLDVFFIQSMIRTAETTMERFNLLMIQRYPEMFGSVPVYDTHSIYNRILIANLSWGNETALSPGPCSDHTADPGLTETEYNITRAKRTVESLALKYAGWFDENQGVFTNNDDPHFLEEDTPTAEEIISHTFHKISIAILTLLLLYTLLKVVCVGWHFLKEKLELFDGMIVITSFALDVGYIQGLTNYPVESFVGTLVIMIPWRVIRVLNSLVIAVRDNFRFRIKLLWRKSKLLNKDLKAVQTSSSERQDTIDALVTLCQNAGVDNSSIMEVIQRSGLLTGTASKTQSNGFKQTFQPFASCFGVSRTDSYHIGLRSITEQGALLEKDDNKTGVHESD